MLSGRPGRVSAGPGPLLLLSKRRRVRPVKSGLSITINTDGAVIDAYVITDRPDEVAEWMRERGWARR